MSEASRDGIAIIGMAGRFPGAESIDALWANLLAGRESITRFAPDQLSPLVPAEVRAHPRYVAARGVIDGAENFDATFFGIGAREAQLIDPQQRVFLELCWNALEHAGVDPSRSAGSIGVYAGTSNNGYRRLVEARPDLVAASGEFAAMLANEKDYVATRVAHKLGLTGPAISLYTACSTSLVAIAQAWYALMTWQCDLALAGGINIVVPQESGYLPVEGAIESADGHCRPFDADASGTVFSSGGGVVVLKRLADALEQGDTIYAVIRGVGINNDGADKASFGAPSVRGQAAAIRLALAGANVDAASIGYVEAHGTGTPLGDPMEVEALTRAFGGDGSVDAAVPPACWIGSLKGNLGHLVAASGVAGLIKATLALHHGRIPPSINYRAANPAIDFAHSPFRVADRLVEWPRGAAPRRAGVSSFGVGGTNAHVVLEEAPRAPSTASGRAVCMLPLSAHDEDALRLRADGLAQYLDTAESDLSDIAATLALGRKPMAWRAAVIARTPAQAHARLAQLAPCRAGKPKLVFVFPGQGSQHANMARELVAGEPVFREHFEHGCALASARLGFDLRATILPAEPETGAADARLAETRCTQPALFVVEYALARLWESWGIVADAMIGHSIGEYVAATLAGVFHLEDAIALVCARGAAMQVQPAGAMLAVRAPASTLATRLRDGVTLAAVNAPELCVVAGGDGAIDAFAQALQADGIASSRLKVSHAFHSPLMDGALAPFERAFAGVTLAPPTRPFFSCVSGRPIETGVAVQPAYWCRQLREPVRFADAVAHAIGEGANLFLEVGPSQATTTFVRSQLGDGARAIASLGSAGKPGSDAEHVAAALAACWCAGREPDWAAYFDGESRRRVALPTYPFRGERHWIDAPGAFAERGPATSIAESEPAPSSMQAGKPTRAISLRASLRELVEQLGGEHVDAAQDEASLLELGLDSLSLTQAALEIERRYGVRLKFRRLMEDLDSIAKLATLLEQHVPADRPAATPAGAPPVVATDEAQPANLVERPFGASARITLKRDIALTPAQRAWIDVFTRDYNARTAQSKAYSQRHRARMADPRVVTGFNPLWKELVYPIVVARSKGAWLTDIDGNDYVDCLNAFGANFLGYQPDAIAEALKAQVDAGYEVGPQHPLAGEVAELIAGMTGMARVAFCNTGSEAVMGAMRIARTVTGRSTIAIFTNSYHGIFDEVIVRGTRSLRSIAAAPGILASAVENVLVLDYGSDAALSILRERAHELAAIMIEPVQGKNPSLQPHEFVRALRPICDAGGCALIFDEVITGFRVAQGGAQTLYGVRADIATYGKIIGGGLPFAAIAGDAKWLDALDGGDWRFGDDSHPEAGVTYFAGTFVRHPLALAAAKAALVHLKQRGPALQDELNARTRALVDRLNHLFGERAAPLKAVGFSSLWRIVADEGQAFASLFWYALRANGLHVYEQFNCFLTEAHGAAEVERIVAAVQAAVDALLGAGLLGAHAPAVADAPVPMTAGQLEKWLGTHYGGVAPLALNEGFALHLRGAFDEAAFERALAQVWQRHEAFRLAFDATTRTQSLQAVTAVPLRRVDFRGADAAARFATFCDEQMRMSFDLARAPLVRCTVARLGESEHALQVVANHLVMDGWSMAVFVGELEQAYNAAIVGRVAALPSAESFLAYAATERARRAGNRAQLDYWRTQHADAPSPLQLPTDRSRAEQADFGADTARHEFPPALVAALRADARRRGITLYGLLLAAFGQWFAERAGAGDVVVGIPFAGQALAGSGALLGDGVNTLPLRLRVDPQAAFDTLAAATHKALLDAAENQDLTLFDILRALPPRRRGGANALGDVVFNLNPRVRDPQFDGLVAEWHDCRHAALLWELFFNLNDSGARLSLDLHYRSALFDATTVRRWIGDYQALLERIAGGARSPQAPEDTRGVAADSYASVLDLVAASVRATPQRIALESRAGSLSYAQLWQRSGELAALLLAQGVARGELVGVCLPRRPELLVGVLGVLRAGAAYVPLDASFPDARLATMIEQASLRHVVVFDGEDLPQVVRTCGARLHAVAQPLPPATQALPAVSGDDLAYVLFTSGSTGTPKGVRVLHRNLANFLASMRDQPGIAVDDVLCAVTTLSFDIAGLELYLPLTVGARVLLADDTEVHDPHELARVIRDGRASVLQTTPTLLRLLVDGAGVGCVRGLKLLVGGEALPRDLANAVMPHCASLWNLYGPTETTIWSTLARVEAGAGAVPLGVPIAHTRIYVLDDEQRLLASAGLGRAPSPASADVSDGAMEGQDDGRGGFAFTPPSASADPSADRGDFDPLSRAAVEGPMARPAAADFPMGEIWIGGRGVADGYLGRADLTAQRFLPDPFAGDGSRMYRTGDLGSLRGGVLHFHGRADDQVKLRGYRIELGDVEAAAANDAGVREAVAAVRRFAEHDARLVLYVSARQAGDATLAARVRAALRESLPPYMRPQHIEVVAAMPKTPNGKIDRNALPLPIGQDAPAPSAQAGAVASNDDYLAALWRETIGVDDVRATDNFFELGGDSLLAVDMMARVERDTGVRLSVLAIATGTLETLAQQIARGTPARGGWFARLRGAFGGARER